MKIKYLIFTYTLLLLFTVSIFIISARINITADEKSGDKCAQCHGNSRAYKEWQVSDHAKSLKTIQEIPQADLRCIKCHSADYNSYMNAVSWGVKINAPTPKTAKEPITCSVCHRHDTGIKHNLVMTSDKLCIFCHKFDCG
ncbi:MAG: multiheme c-type cytochrome [bacterium]